MTQERSIDDCVRIDHSNLDAEFVSLPADLAYWSARYADVYQHFLEKKFVRETVHARLYEAHQARLLSFGNRKAPTIAEIEGQIATDDEYQEAMAAEIAAEASKVRIYGYLDAIRAKRDMLISLGAKERALMNADPMIALRGRA
jgi:hypothetical protein